MTDLTMTIAFVVAAYASVTALNAYFAALRSRWAAEAWVQRFRARQMGAAS